MHSEGKFYETSFSNRILTKFTCSSLCAILIFTDLIDELTCSSCLANVCFSVRKKLCACFVFTLSETSCNDHNYKEVAKASDNII